MTTHRIIITFLCLILATGCAQLKAVFESVTPQTAPARQLPPPAPARQSPPPAPARQSPPPAASVPQIRQEPPAPRLSPQVSSDRELQLTEEVNTLMRGVERTLLSVDHQKLKADQWETYQTIHSFLAQAKEALTTKDLQQAINLAQKAHVLSDELSKGTR